MNGWTDADDPDGAYRRARPPADEPPSWLTDRPEPRSAYLFGDEPGQPGDDRWADAPTGRFGRPPAETTPYRDRTSVTPPVDLTARPETTGSIPVVDLAARAGALRPASEPAADGQGRHRQKGRLPRPLLIGGAAAAATLVVSLGVGALVLPSGDEDADQASFDDTVAAAPVAPGLGGAPADALAATGSPTTAAPTASPTTARPTPSPSRSVAPAPAPKRTQAPSRQSTVRTTAPTASPTRNTLSAGASSQVQQVVDLVNAERARAGCGAVQVDDKLMLAAQRHSQDQADHQDMTHTGSDGSDAGERLDRVGYSWRTYGENVAWNQQTPAAVMEAWMNSSGHRANILNCAFTEIGVGVATSNGPYWTQDFAAPR
ncbi:CAP domain-containing protein [Micromonospora sp. CPCC 205711]|uniref:CAP domain-containing protein n=1 Tax=Micromonospora sp. CPCC 205547 TaxID=3122400 RepID=UPI002FF20847